jgi:MFS family permease
MELATGIYYLAVPLLLIDLKANPIELGLVAAISSLTYMAMAHFMGRLSDRLGRRRLIIIAPALFVFSCLLMTIAGEVKVILVLSVITGFCLSMFWPPFQAWVVDRQTETGLARNIGSFNMSWTAANLLGPVFSGFLYSLHPRLPFFVSAAIAFILFFLVWASLHERQATPVVPERPASVEARHDRRIFLYVAWVANFATWFIIGNCRYQFPKLARELNIPPQIIGLLLGSTGFALFMGFFILRKGERWHFKTLHLLGAQFLLGGGVLVLLLSSQPIFFASAFIIIGTSGSVTYYSSLYYAVHLLKAKGRGSGLHESILGGGAVLGPILGGIAAQYEGLRAPYLLCLVVLWMAVIVELILLRRKNSHGI